MNITILANQDLASCLALNHLLPALQDHRLAIVISARVGRQGAQPEPLAQLAFFEQALFNQLLFPALDGAPARNRGELLTFRGLANRFSCSLQELNAINSGAELESFQATAPDLVLSIRYGVILKEPAIAVPRLGVLNLHSGILPDYKGVMATFRAMQAGESEIGTTLHFIDDAGIDTGRIVTIDRQPLQLERSYLGNVLSLYEPGCHSLAAAVATLAGGGELVASSQQGGDYFSFPGPEDFAAFSEKGYTLVDSRELLTLARRFLPAERA